MRTEETNAFRYVNSPKRWCSQCQCMKDKADGYEKPINKGKNYRWQCKSCKEKK